MTPRKPVPGIPILGQRFRAGETIRSLSRETGIEYCLLRRRFIEHGFLTEGLGQPIGHDLGAFVRIPVADPLLARLRKIHPGVRA